MSSNRWLLATGVLLSSAIFAKEYPDYSPPNAKVEIDNPWVRVFRVNETANQHMSTYRHPDMVWVYLTDARLEFKGSGPPKIETHKAGEVSYLVAGAHSEANLTGKPIEVVVIELKPNAPKSPPIRLDPVVLDRVHHPVLFENSRVRVLHTILEPHLKSPEHEHPHYVVVYLTELHTKMQLGDGRVVDNPRRPGEIAWRDALKHVTEQVGDKTAEEIQVEIK
jgi:hypothetical protein